MGKRAVPGAEWEGRVVPIRVQEVHSGGGTQTTKSPHHQWPVYYDQSPCSHAGRPLWGKSIINPNTPHPSQDHLTLS